MMVLPCCHVPSSMGTLGLMQIIANIFQGYKDPAPTRGICQGEQWNEKIMAEYLTILLFFEIEVNIPNATIHRD